MRPEKKGRSNHWLHYKDLHFEKFQQQQMGSFHSKCRGKKTESATFYWIWWTMNEQRAMCNGFSGWYATEIFIHIWSKAKQIERKRNWHFACNQMRIAYKIACGFIVVVVVFLDKSTPIDQFDTNFYFINFYVCCCCVSIEQLHKWFVAWTFPSNLCYMLSQPKYDIYFFSVSQKVERVKFSTHTQFNILHWFVEQQQKSAPISLICII